jgi:hypothetical protein
VAPLRDACDHLPPAETHTLRAGLAGASADPARFLELEAPQHALRELLAVAIDETADTLGEEATRLLRGDGSGAEVRARLTQLSRLVDLLEQVEHRG